MSIELVPLADGYFFMMVIRNGYGIPKALVTPQATVSRESTQL